MEALYDHGRLEFTPPIKLKNEPLRLMVEVPDESVLTTAEATPPPVPQSSTGIRAEIDAILGTYLAQLRRGQPLSAAECKDLWHEHLEEKYLGRGQASDS